MQLECIEVEFYGWLAHSDADTSSQVSFGGKTPRFQTKSRVSPCFGPSQDSRVGKRFRASNMLMHCNEVQWLDSPVFVHGDLVTSLQI